jgi:hypothetical protein
VGGITFGNMLAGGKSHLLIGTSDFYLLKLDSSGTVISLSGMGLLNGDI